MKLIKVVCKKSDAVIKYGVTEPKELLRLQKEGTPEEKKKAEAVLKKIVKSQEFDYKYLKRLKRDSEYTLNAIEQSKRYGGLSSLESAVKYLHGKSVNSHIKEMKDTYDKLVLKPEWLTEKDILVYKNKLDKMAEEVKKELANR